MFTINYVINNLIVLLLAAVVPVSRQDVKGWDTQVNQDTSNTEIEIRRDYDKIISQNKYVLILFYSETDDCPNCEKLVPLFKRQIKKYLKIVTPAIKFFSIPIETVPEFSRRELIYRIPTVRFYLDGDRDEFIGQITIDGIADWMKRLIAVAKIPHKRNIYFVERNQFPIVIKGFNFFVGNFYGPNCKVCDTLKPVFFNIARRMREQRYPFYFARIASTPLMRKLNITRIPSIVLFRHGVPIIYKGNFHINHIEKWLKAMYEAMKIPRQRNLLILNLKNFFVATKGYPYLVILFYNPDCGRCMTFLPQFEKSARILIQKQTPIVLAKVDLDFAPELKTMLKIKSVPKLVFVNNGVMNMYGGDFKYDPVMKWMNNQIRFKIPVVDFQYDYDTPSRDEITVIQEIDVVPVPDTDSQPIQILTDPSEEFE